MPRFVLIVPPCIMQRGQRKERETTDFEYEPEAVCDWCHSTWLKQCDGGFLRDTRGSTRPKHITRVCATSDCNCKCCIPCLRASRAAIDYLVYRTLRTRKVTAIRGLIDALGANTSRLARETRIVLRADGELRQREINDVRKACAKVHSFVCFRHRPSLETLVGKEAATNHEVRDAWQRRVERYEEIVDSDDETSSDHNVNVLE